MTTDAGREGGPVRSWLTDTWKRSTKEVHIYVAWRIVASLTAAAAVTAVSFDLWRHAWVINWLVVAIATVGAFNVAVRASTLRVTEDGVQTAGASCAWTELEIVETWAGTVLQSKRASRGDRTKIVLRFFAPRWHESALRADVQRWAPELLDGAP